jgi:hypothetical protein
VLRLTLSLSYLKQSRTFVKIPDVRTTVDGQGGSVTALTGTMCNIVQSQNMLYVTDEEPSAGISNGPGAGQGGSVTAQTGTMCNIVEPITVLQENYETDEEEFWGGKNNTQETEAGPGGSVTALTGLQSNSIYETDEDEFLRSWGEEEIKPAVSTTFHALYDVHVPRKMKNTAKRKITPHSLAYFILWWMRMEVEGKKMRGGGRRRKRMRKSLGRILQKDNESSFEFLVEGAILESTGSENQLYFMDGTRADKNRQL